jgi:DNA-binding PadR family transcriptional regulator
MKMSISDLTSYEQAIVNSWVDTHKKSTLVLFILLSLSAAPSWSGQLRVFIDELSDGHLRVDEQSLHRALRRLDSLNVITHTTEDAPGTGLKRKIYTLTQTGERILNAYLATTLSYARKPRFQELIEVHGSGGAK